MKLLRWLLLPVVLVALLVLVWLAGDSEERVQRGRTPDVEPTSHREITSEEEARSTEARAAFCSSVCVKSDGEGLL